MKPASLISLALFLAGAVQAQTAPAPSLPQLGNLLNPNISVIGTFLGTAGREQAPESEAGLRLKEAELGLQSVVDPYSRADFFIAIGDDGVVDLEEGYLSFLALPGGFSAKLGKFRMDLGKLNRTHPGETAFADRPLAARRFFGAEGLAGAGGALSYLIPNPMDLYLNAELEVVNTPPAGEAPAFGAADRGDLLYLGRVSTFVDLGESVNVTLGGTYADGANGLGYDAAAASSSTLRTGVLAADLTLRWKDPKRAIYQSLFWQTEGYSVRSEQVAGPATARFGAFSHLEWQFARRWRAGGRYDWSQSPILTRHEEGGLAYLTFDPSEFSRLSLQGRQLRLADGTKETVGWLKVTFNIGPHGAHPF